MIAFHALPLTDINHPWLYAVHKAYHIMNDTHFHISRVLWQEGLDPMHLNQHSSMITHNSLLILEALEMEALKSRSNYCLPSEWLKLCVVAVGELLVETLSAAESVNGKYVIIMLIAVPMLKIQQ
jgi:hypothetical protein